MSKIVKISGTFSAVGDTVTLVKPPHAATIALRLYERTLEIALWVLTDPHPDLTIHPDQTPVRTFVAHPLGEDLPPQFMKYIGAMGIPDPSQSAGFSEVQIIEVSQ